LKLGLACGTHRSSCGVYTVDERKEGGVEEVSEGDERKLNDIINTAGNMVRRLT
jgi:hypothetical protein